MRVSSVEYGLDQADEALAAMVVGGFLYDFWLILIGVFALMGARAEKEVARHPCTAKAR